MFDYEDDKYSYLDDQYAELPKNEKIKRGQTDKIGIIVEPKQKLAYRKARALKQQLIDDSANLDL